jgi:metal-dependent amidase/aminoacylase/carboxypeptidase family protein
MQVRNVHVPHPDPPMTTAEETELLIQTRRDLHRHPEIGFQEFRTAGIVAERLRAAGYEVQTGIAETGVIGTLHGGAGDGRTLLLRADMDALPVDEETTHDFRSTVEGKMHACGHDEHVAVGLAVAERLARTRGEWAGTVKYMFQPAEEGLGGALGMIDAGVCAAMGATYEFHYRMEAVPTVNDPALAELVRREAVAIVGPDRVRTDPDVRTMAAEDFGDVLAKVPGCYFFVGGRNEARGMTHPHHSPRFDLCEDCMPVAVSVLEAAARAYLAGE